MFVRQRRRRREGKRLLGDEQGHQTVDAHPQRLRDQVDSDLSEQSSGDAVADALHQELEGRAAWRFFEWGRGVMRFLSLHERDDVVGRMAQPEVDVLVQPRPERRQRIACVEAQIGRSHV